MLTLIVVLVIVAFLLFLLELFMPGLVLASLAGVILIAAVVLTYIEFTFLAGTLLLLGSIAICCLGFWVWASTFDKTPFGKTMTLTSAVKSEKDHPQYGEFLGKPGITITPLVPSGIAMFGSRRLDVVADTGLIEKGSNVYVSAVDGTRVVVRLVEEPQYRENPPKA